MTLWSSAVLAESKPETAADIHESILVMDSHLDTPALLIRPDFDIMARHDPLKDGSQVDYPRMQEGGLDGGFWVIFSRQGPVTAEGFQASRDTAILRAFAIHKMTAEHPDVFELATTPEDGPRIHAAGKRLVYLSIENAYPLGEDITLLKTFYDLGVRMVGPVHFANNQFGDSSTDPKGQQWQGLSPLGKELVAEANRLGMILDGSHAHDELVRQMMDLSKTPIVLSHSGAKSIYDHPRNVPDDILLKLAETGGVIQMNAFSGYLTKLPDNPERTKAFAALRVEADATGDMTPALQAEFNSRRLEINIQHPPSLASFNQYMAHFLHVLKLIGPDHVGVSGDFDGGGGIEDMYDIAAFPYLSARLLEEGYSKADLEKIWGGNLLRLLGNARDYAAE
ncbi:MAG: membrane dipeptidase [Candidatus Azotimanducaceae bacterium]|jgi:membrane dipeptidase